MKLLPILCIPDPRLRQVSKPVAQVDDATRALMDDMLATMYDAPGIGIAAIQVGVARRVVVIDLAKKGETPAPMFFVNPEVTWSSGDFSSHEEGCLSIPDYFEAVERPAKVTVRHLDRFGAPKELHAEGILATALQHEIDHLDGVLFIDHISKLKRDRVIKKFTKAAKREAEERGLKTEA